MATSVENPAEHDTASLADNSHPQQKRGSDDDLGVGAGEKRWPGWPGESVFRILVPAPKVGGIIGRKGEFIKKICEESRARIKILDGPPAIKERAVIISAKEEPDVATPPAVDGLLRIHRRIIDGLDSESAPPAGGTVSTRLLVAAAQAGSLIGRQGATVKSIQEASGVIVRVLGPEELPPFALQDDRIVEVQGDPAGVLKAVELIASHLRKFLVDRSVIPLFEKHMSPSGSQVEQHMPHHPWGHPQGPPNSSGPVYGGNSQFMPSRQHDGYYPPQDLPPLDRHHPSGPLYGQIHSSMNAQPPPPIIKQMTQQMQIPLSYADAVIGSSGANISYIRRASGATVTIQESRGVLGEMTVEINGTATQVQTAQQLIQNAMAEAAGRPLNPPGPVDPAYNSYPPRGPTYASPPPSAGHASGGYGTTYGANYGY